MKKTIWSAVVFSLALAAAARTSSSDRSMLEFDSMAAVVEPFTGSNNPIRNLNGGGLPWEIDEANGELREDGRLEVEVRGLVLARRAPVPEARQGINPVSTFRAIVSCLTSEMGVPMVENVATDAFPASITGDSEIEATVDLPTPCFAPIIFVTSPGGSWFAVTGRDGDSDGDNEDSDSDS